MPQPKEKPASRTLVLGTILFYMFAAIAMVLANKWVLDKTSIPVFFLEVQLLIAVVMLAFSKWLGFFDISLTLERDTCKALIPMIAINVLGLNFNNLTLKFVDASFYQVARGLLLPITVGFSTVLLRSRPSLRILLSCGVVTFGFFVGVLIDNPDTRSALWGESPPLADPDPAAAGDPAKRAMGIIVVARAVARAAKGPSTLGVLFGVLSSCTTALHAVVIKRSLEAVKGNTLQLAWYSNALSALVLLPMLFVAGEVSGILSLFFGGFVGRGQDGLSALATFLWGSALTGFVGFLICIAGFLSIKITSPITHMVSAAVRGVLQTFLAVIFFGDKVTTGRGSSIIIILAGSIYYTWVKNEETFHNNSNASDASGTKSNSSPMPGYDDEERQAMLEAGDVDKELANGNRLANGSTVLFNADDHDDEGGDGFERVPMEQMKSSSANGNGSGNGSGPPPFGSRRDR